LVKHFMDSLMDNVVTLQDYISQLALRFESADLFFGHGTDNPYDEAVYIVFVLLGIEFDHDVDLASKTLSAAQLARLEEAARRRIDGHIPAAYLVGSAWFAGIKFNSDSRALVPRSPLAELISSRFAGLVDTDPQRVLDMCTGSGCIGLATALEYPHALVDLADISAEALDLAASNVSLHDLSSRVSLLLSDGFEAITGAYDLILCNPPYVSRDEYAELPLEYFAEPALGLLSEDEGLALPIKLLEQAGEFIKRDGLLIMEVGFSQDALKTALPDVPFLWLEFTHGGSGVFCLTGKQLRSFSATRK
jgi:ribosomal protein L3 glutamine methyltransferase